MAEKNERLFDKLMSEDQKTYDEKMLPLIEQEVKANFQSVLREGEKMKISLEKDFWNKMFRNPENADIDAMANNKLKVKAIDEKMQVVKELYEELFNEKMS